ncbi:MAG: NAD(P)-binding protein [Syntrophomonadaceae bacterium]|nr:NAD(P)-binding protein [Syntrophomonadaceae bacterium]
MTIRLRGIRIPLDHSMTQLRKAAAKHLNIKETEIVSCKPSKRAVDARRQTVQYTYTLDLNLAGDMERDRRILDLPGVVVPKEQVCAEVVPGSQELHQSPLIVGSGPAGLFCALYLARRGYSPVVIERGPDMDRRIKAVEGFWQGGPLDPAANAQYGEGGAGTFSDGKLTTRSGDERIDMVLQTFVDYGANEEILYVKKPHVGTNIIRQAVKRIRQEIIALGGEIYFDACLTDINVNQGRLKSIIINNEIDLPVSLLVLATGNSARDVYSLLYRRQVQLSPKAFALGVRVEHPQEVIDRQQYGNFAGHPSLGAADYHLTYQDRASGRALYTFCMCPGGYVIAAASQAGGIVTNGMSYDTRDSGIANSALVVTVNPADWHNTTLGGIELQERLEQKAFAMGGGDYRAPAQLLQDFLQQKATLSLEGSLASYQPGVVAANFWELFDPEISGVMQQGIREWGHRMPVFLHPHAVLTGVETRTSAPVRMERDEYMCSSLENLYPCGEGSGYAGGIVSSAVDGIKVAQRIINTYGQPINLLQINHHGVTSARDLECK